MLNNLNWKLLSVPNNLNDSVSKRSSHTINYVNNKIYIFGGENQPRTPIDNDFLVYDTHVNTWSISKSKSLPEEKPFARLGHSSCSINNTIFIFGGRSGVEMDESSLNDLFAYHTVTEKWTLLSKGEENAPEARSYHTMTALGNKLYVFGGCSASHGRFNDLYEFDLKSHNWRKLNSFDSILPRGGSCLCAYENDTESCLYVIGGFSGQEQDDCFKFDLKTETWSQIENLPRKLSVFACSSFDKNQKVRLILQGGEVDPSTLGHNGAGEFTNETFLYDGTKWYSIDTLTTEQLTNRGWHHGCGDLDGNFYIFGGNLENNHRNNELWVLKLSN
jgi:N-acetylneuraminic acid mutarotase